MKALIVGGAGFIGSHAVRHFVESGDEVAVFDKMSYAADKTRLDGLIDPRCVMVYDICDKLAVGVTMRAWTPDVVVNFAAETHVDNSIQDASPFVKTNFEGACNLMTACREVGALYVHLSTDEVYGVPDTDAVRGFEVGDPLNPRNPYSATKAAADMMLLANLNTHNQEFLAFRPSNNYGPNQHEEKFLPKLVRCLVSQPDGHKTDFPLYGDGGQRREWTFAPDTARVIRHGIVNGWRGFHNVSSNVTFKNIEIVECVKSILEVQGKLANPDAVRHVQDRPGHDRRYWIESKVDPLLFTRFEEAICLTVEHYFQKFA